MNEQKRPVGWYSKEAKAQRNAEWSSRRAAAAELRDQRERDRREQDQAIARRLEPIRKYAAARLQELASREKPAPVAVPRSERKGPKRSKRQAKKDAKKALAKQKRGRESLKEKWKHKNEGTPETHEHAEAQRHNQGALARLHASGAIDDDQLAYSEEIATIAEQIEADVAVKTASLETRVDTSRRNDGAICEGLNRVRMEMAYTRWRRQLPAPKRAVLDMIVGDAIGYTVAAKRYSMHNRKAKQMLIDALDRWPDCVAWARKEINAAELAAMQAGLL